MTGARSFSVSNGRFGSRLGLAPWVSNTSTNVAPSGGDVTAAWVPIAPDAPPRFSIRIDTFRFRSSIGCARRAIRSVVPPGGNGTMMRMVFGGQAWARAGSAYEARLHNPAARTTSARHDLFTVGSRRFVASGLVGFRSSLRRAPAVDLDRAGLDPRNELAAEFDRVVERVEAANEKRVHPKAVVFEDRIGDLFGRADETRGVAERAGDAGNRHPQPFVV